MKEPRPLDLNYGHLGRPHYDSEKHEWQFSRHPDITRQFIPLEEPTITLPSSCSYIFERPRNATERSWHIQELTTLYPELQPATPLIPELAKVSEAVHEVTSGRDPLISDILAFGQADYPHVHGARASIPILAVAGGAAGDSVRLILLTSEQLGWRDDRRVFLNNLTSKRREESLWTGNGSPIQQIVFAESEGQPSSWLAIRYHGAVSILRPRFNPCPPGSASISAATLESRLDPNPTVTLSINQSRGIPFSDVAFNPGNSQQIATLDQGGCWCVWLLQKNLLRKGTWIVKQIHQGLVLDSVLNNGPPILLEDGWGLVRWASSSRALIVMTRERLAILDMKGIAKRLDVPDVLSKNSTEWILDVEKNTTDDGSFFLVTSSTLFWIGIVSTDEDETLAVQCLLSWKHFLDSADITLRLHVSCLPTDVDNKNSTTETTLLLYSCLSGTISVYTFKYSGPITDCATSASDPFSLAIPWIKSPDRSPVPIKNILIRGIPYGFNYKRSTFGLGQLYFENGVKFYQLIILYQDLSLSECLYAETSQDSDLNIQLPYTRRGKDTVKTPKYVLDDFIIPDGSGFLRNDNALDETIKENHGSSSEIATPSDADLFDRDQWSISFDWLERTVRRSLNELTAAPMESFIDLLQDLEACLDKRSAIEGENMGTLLDLARAKVSITDVDEAASLFKLFLDRIGHYTPSDQDQVVNPSLDKRAVLSKTVQPPKWRLFSRGDDPQVVEVYDGLIETWIGLLSQKVPSRSRIYIENSMRNLTVQICLGSYTIRLDSAKSAAFVLPVRRRASVASAQKGKRSVVQSRSSPASSQLSADVGSLPSYPVRVLPTPEPIPSVHSQSSASSFAVNPSSQRLQAYCNLMSQPALPSQLASMLGQWQVGTDPANYHWEATQQDSTSDDDGEVEARAKKRERAEKRQKKRHGSTIGSSSQPLPRILGGSQPEQRPEAEDSSQTVDDILMASQDEPGRDGGRPATPKEKKSSGPRRPGF